MESFSYICAGCGEQKQEELTEDHYAAPLRSTAGVIVPIDIKRLRQLGATLCPSCFDRAKRRV